MDSNLWNTKTKLEKKSNLCMNTNQISNLSFLIRIRWSPITLRLYILEGHLYDLHNPYCKCEYLCKPVSSTQPIFIDVALFFLFIDSLLCIMCCVLRSCTGSRSPTRESAATGEDCICAARRPSAPSRWLLCTPYSCGATGRRVWRTRAGSMRAYLLLDYYGHALWLFLLVMIANCLFRFMRFRVWLLVIVSG